MRIGLAGDCFDAFATAFDEADRVIVSEIYAAGEDKIPGIDGESLARAIRAHGHRNADFEAELSEIARRLPDELEAGDLVITLGAGNISGLGALLLDQLSERDATGGDDAT